MVTAHFKVGDKAVYPGHGVAQIMGVEWREIAGSKKEFFILKILDNDLKIMIPIDGVARTGLRCAICREDAQKVFEILGNPEISVTAQPWSQRCREYAEMLKSGSAFEVAKLLRDLHCRKNTKELSRSEQRFYDQSRCLLLSEIALTNECDQLSVAEKIEDVLSKLSERHMSQKNDNSEEATLSNDLVEKEDHP